MADYTEVPPPPLGDESSKPMPYVAGDGQDGRFWLGYPHGVIAGGPALTSAAYAERQIAAAFDWEAFVDGVYDDDGWAYDEEKLDYVRVSWYIVRQVGE